MLGLIITLIVVGLIVYFIRAYKRREFPFGKTATAVIEE